MNRRTDATPPPSGSSRLTEGHEPFVESDISPLTPQEIGSASRSCLVILALVTVIILLVCVSWLVRLLF